MTFQIAGLPKAFRENQEKSAKEFINQKLNALSGDIQVENLAQRQIENAAKNQETQRRNSVLSLASQQLSTGKPMSREVRQLIAANGHGVLPPETIKMLMADDLPTQMAGFKALEAQSAGTPLAATLNDPNSGMQIRVGGGGGSGRPITAGELSDSLANGKDTARLTEAGFTVQTEEGRKIVRAAYEERKALEKQRVGISQDNSTRAQTALEQVRPEESKKLTSLQAAHRGASGLLDAYEAAITSHGGKMNTDLKIALTMASRSPDTFIGKSIQWFGQQHPKLTQQDIEFLTQYARMQKFARGAMDDVGNLSNFERGIFQTMIGTPLDDSRVFRSRIGGAIKDAEHAYDQEYRSLGVTRNLSAFSPTLGVRAPGTTPARNNGQLQPASPQQQEQQAERRYNPATRTFEEIKR
jgi:hypothetical protein